MGICCHCRFKQDLGGKVCSSGESDGFTGKVSGKDDFGKSFIVPESDLNRKSDPTKQNLKSIFKTQSQKIHPKILKFYQQVFDLISIQEVSLKAFVINKTQAKYLRIVLSYSQNLVKLNLCETQLGNSGLLKVSKSFLFTPELKVLTIEQNFINDFGFASFALDLRHLVKLEVLSFGGNSIETEGMKSMVQAFDYLLKLKEVHLHNNQVDFKVLEVLAGFLLKFKNVEVLGLEFNKLDSSCVDLIFEIGKKTQVKQLKVRQNLFTQDEIEKLFFELSGSGLDV